MRKITNNELGRLSPNEFAATAKTPMVVVLDNVRSAMNVGSFFRTADAFALSEVILCGITATPPSKEIHKTALGAELTIPHRLFTDTTAALQTLREEGCQIIVVEQVENSVSLEKYPVDPTQKYALVFGNEVDGVSQHAVDMADAAVEIPQRGTKHSLNVSVAGGIVLWHFFKSTL